MATGMIIQLVLIAGIFWFLLIVPQRREAKRHREMLAALRPGDEVVTAGGIIGEIIQMKDDQITIKSGDSRLIVEKARITRQVTA
jgi:preprotein translocase subunit YajC